MKRLLVYDKDFNQLGALSQATEIQRHRRINSDYDFSFVIPMSSDDYDIVQIKGHIKDERGQYYVINDRSRKREGVKRMVQFDCMHVMFKLTDFKFPYASYVEEAFGQNISTLLNSISAATGGKFTFSIDDSFDLKDIKDFGRGNCLQALNYVLDTFGCEVEPDNFVIHVKKQIGIDRGYQARIRKNIININFKDSSRALVTRMYSQMKDGLSFIGLQASNLTADEYALLNAVPGAIVGGIIKVNYLISPYAGYWSNTTNTYFDNELIDTNIEDPLELLNATRKALREQEVPAIDVPLNVADLHKTDKDELEIFLGDTIHMIDSEMQINNISARVMEITEYPFDPGQQPNITLANYFMRDYRDIIADLDRSKAFVDRIVSGGKVLTSSFENFASQAVHDIDNSKTEIIYDHRGIVLRSQVNQNDQVVMSSKGLYITRDGGQTAAAALTAAGLIAEKVFGKLGNFITIEIGSGNNVFKSDQNGIYLGNQVFGSAPFRVNMAGQLTATQATITGTINATGGTFSGNITATGTITGGTLIGATIKGGTIEIGSGNSVFKSDTGGIYLGNQSFSSAPFHVDMAGNLYAKSGTFDTPLLRDGQLVGGSININNGQFTVDSSGHVVAQDGSYRGMIYASGGSFAGNISATGTITGGTIIGALIETSSSYPRAEMSSTDNYFKASASSNQYVAVIPFFSGQNAPMIEFVNGASGSTGEIYINNINGQFSFQSADGLFLSASASTVRLDGGRVEVPSWAQLFDASANQSLQTALSGKVRAGGGEDIMLQWFSNYLEVWVGGVHQGNINLV